MTIIEWKTTRHDHLNKCKKEFDKTQDPIMIRKTQQSRNRSTFIKGMYKKDAAGIIKNTKIQLCGLSFLTTEAMNNNKCFCFWFIKFWVNLLHSNRYLIIIIIMMMIIINNTRKRGKTRRRSSSSRNNSCGSGGSHWL